MGKLDTLIEQNQELIDLYKQNKPVGETSERVCGNTVIDINKLNNE